MQGATATQQPVDVELPDGLPTEGLRNIVEKQAAMVAVFKPSLNSNDTGVFSADLIWANRAWESVHTISRDVPQAQKSVPLHKLDMDVHATLSYMSKAVVNGHSYHMVSSSRQLSHDTAEFVATTWIYVEGLLVEVSSDMSQLIELGLEMSQQRQSYVDALRESVASAERVVITDRLHRQVSIRLADMKQRTESWDLDAPDSYSESLAALSTEVDSVIASVRAAISSIKTSGQTRSISAALYDVTTEFTSAFGSTPLLQVNAVDQIPESASREAELMLREMFTSAARQKNPRQIDVSVNVNDATFHMEVRDSGADSDTIASETGVVALGHRLRVMGGHLMVTPLSGSEGTQTTVICPTRNLSIDGVSKSAASALQSQQTAGAEVMFTAEHRWRHTPLPELSRPALAKIINHSMTFVAAHTPVFESSTSSPVDWELAWWNHAFGAVRTTPPSLGQSMMQKYFDPQDAVDWAVKAWNEGEALQVFQMTPSMTDHYRTAQLMIYIDTIWFRTGDMVVEAGNDRSSVLELGVELTRQRQNYIEQLRSNVIAAERIRIANDLHDSVIQSLFALGMTLQALEGEELLADDIKDIQDRLQECHFLMNEAVGTVRQPDNQSSSLSEEILDVVEEFVSHFAVKPEISVAVNTEPNPQLAREVKMVVREGIANIVRHANASTFWLHVGSYDHKLQVRLRDNGVGIQGTSGRRSGTLSLSQRAAVFGGTFYLQNHPEGGAEMVWTAEKLN